MLDEIDKIGASYQGDPASALLEVLDPEQNREFLDHYLDVRFDLSSVFFVCTANQTDTIPRPLLDRMEVIPLSGYILEEKLQIAKRYLVPRQAREHGIAAGRVTITTPALRAIIDGYAREPGVRSLDKHIRKIMRRTVRRMVDDRALRVKVNAKDVAGYLGNPTFTEESLYATPMTGVMTGLAWTSMGGAVLHVEALSVDAERSGFKQTGQLGAVMVESAELAYTYVRSFLDGDATAKSFLQKRFVHLHVPAGATPKDGPSAGITMAAALYSLARGIPPRKGFAMTGELTLTGRVMPIGGVKEKSIAAKRAKLTELIFPEDNRKDFEELPPHVRRGLKPHYVRMFSDVVALLFTGKAKRSAGKAVGANRPLKKRPTRRSALH
jgi:ATP-dependent Lon protease